MESEKHFFLEGLFVIGFVVAAAIFSIWLVRSGHRDDVLYRIHFAESVSGLALGDSVKYHGVDVGTVKSMSLDAEDPRKVEVDVSLRKDAPVKTDTKAGLKLKGITGGVYIELDGGSAKATSLLAATPAGEIPEIPSQKSQLTTVLEQLPGVIKKFSALEDQGKKVMSDVSEVTEKITEHPLMKFGRKKDKTAAPDK